MSKPSILIIDEDREAMVSTSIRLRKCGYKTIGATDAPEALQRVRKDQPDLVLLDSDLPNAMALFILKSIKTNLALHDLPVVALSRSDLPERKSRLLRAGASDFLVKPIPTGELIDVIEGLLESGWTDPHDHYFIDLTRPEDRGPFKVL